MNSPTVSILPMLPIRVAAAQMPEGGAEPRIDVIRRLAAEAKAGGAELVVFPEYVMCSILILIADFINNDNYLAPLLPSFSDMRLH